MISIITVAYNDARGLAKTLDSILGQSCTADVESIVVDGGSTDGTDSVLEEYRKKFDAAGIRFDARSEKDGGIYDGMNKGITRASGDWVYFLNAGDVLYADDVLARISAVLKTCSNDVVYGDVCSVESDRDKSDSKSDRDKTVSHIMKSGDDIDAIKTNLPFCHQAVFTRRALHDRYMYSEDYRLAADYELFLHAYLDGATFAHVPVVVASFMLDGASNRNRKKLFLEYEKIHREYGLAATGIRGALLHAWGLFKISIANAMPERIVYWIMEKRING